MTARNFCILATVIFAVIAVLQLAHALTGLPVTARQYHRSDLAVLDRCDCLAALAWLGYQASGR
jgi:hypothetical protein